MTTPPDAVDPAEHGEQADPATQTEHAAHGLLAPSTLRPVELDLRTVFWAITGGFALALVVFAVIGLTGSVEGRTVAICATGVGLGFLAQGWLRWREASLRRRASHAGDAGPTPSDATA